MGTQVGMGGCTQYRERDFRKYYLVVVKHKKFKYLTHNKRNTGLEEGIPIS